MSDVTFTPEQIAEIRRRILTTQPGRYEVSREAVLGCFPLPKVTRYRTFRSRSNIEYRVVDGFVEGRYLICGQRGWEPAGFADNTVPGAARTLASNHDWTALAEFADVCARPTEEVDA